MSKIIILLNFFSKTTNYFIIRSPKSFFLSFVLQNYSLSFIHQIYSFHHSFCKIILFQFASKNNLYHSFFKIKILIIRSPEFFFLTLVLQNYIIHSPKLSFLSLVLQNYSLYHLIYKVIILFIIRSPKLNNYFHN